jgi:hypothetical protein
LSLTRAVSVRVRVIKSALVGVIACPGTNRVYLDVTAAEDAEGETNERAGPQ